MSTRCAILALSLIACAGAMRAQTAADTVLQLLQEGLHEDTIGTPAARLRAIELWTRALPIVQRLGERDWEEKIVGRIGIAYFSLGRHDSARVYLHRLVPMLEAEGDRKAEEGILSILGESYDGVGLPDSAIIFYRRSLAMARELGNQDHVAQDLGSIAGIFARIGMPDSALVYYREALPMLRAAGDRFIEGRALGNMGALLIGLGQPDSASDYVRRALLIAREVGDTLGLVVQLRVIGSIHEHQGRLDSALVYYHQALPLARVATVWSGEASTLASIGKIFAMRRQADSASAYLDQALALSRSRDDRSTQADVLQTMALVQSKLHRPDSALVLLREALLIARGSSERTAEAVLLGDIAWQYAAIDRLDSATAYYERATSTRAATGRHAGSDFGRLSFNEVSGDYFSSWTLAWLDRAPRAGQRATPPHTVDSSVAAYAALAASERGRARALLDLMRDTAAYAAPGADLAAEGARLANVVRRSNAAGLIYVSTGDTLVTWLLSSGGAVHVYRSAIRADSLAARIAELRATLGVDSARDVEFEPEAARARRRADPAAWRAGASALVALLLPPDLLRRLEGDKEIVIVPQGALALVPFAALPIGSGGEPLGAEWGIRYAPSLTTLAQVESKAALPTGAARSARLRQALVVGNPAMPQITLPGGRPIRLSPLPGAEQESRDIAAQFGTQALTGPKASETVVVRRLPSAPIVHLATHGFAYSSESQARNSFVALAPDSVNDGLLTVGSILDDPALQMSADLVALSACQTGLGDLKQAEGTVGLQRAFLARGARSVLVSLWNVSDAATRALMTDFYRHWLTDADHPDKAESLRRAQEDVRHAKGWEDPRYWAPFQLVGAQ